MALGDVGPAQLPREQHPRPGNLRYGLFTVAPPQTIIPIEGDPNLPDHAFGAGFFYDPLGCGSADLYEATCGPGAVKTFDPNSPEREVIPFTVIATLACGPYGYTHQYLTDKTGERLFSSEQHAAEAALWAGAPNNAPNFVDDLTAVDVGAGGTFVNIVDAVAALEQHAYGTVPYGYNAVLHARTAVHAYAAEAGLVHSANVYGSVWGVPATDPVLRTALGTKWVFGGGYPGTGLAGAAPAPGETFVWITGNVSVWRDAVWRPPNLFETMTRELNQYNVIAERRYAASYDCFAATANVAIPKVAGP